MKRTGVQQPIDALPHGQLSAGVLALDVGGSAHLLREFDATLYLFDFGFPGQELPP